MEEFPAAPEEVLVLQERVSEAQRQGGQRAQELVCGGAHRILDVVRCAQR